MINPNQKEPLNAVGFVIIIVAFAIHMAAIIGYQISDWLIIAALVMYPVGFILFIISDSCRKDNQ